MQNKKSLICYFICCAILLGTGLIYYPKWKQERTETTISWDVSGYYFYLPAIFIYKDLKQLAFKEEILDKYHPTPDLQQAYQHANGNYVLKYASGMALQYLPFFAVAHVYASLANVPADGFSWPYQLAISLGSLLVACLGLWLLRRILLDHFDDAVAGATLLIIVTATNYLDYTAINGAMSHNYLFTLYCLLIYLSAKYWRRPGLRAASALGLVTGLMVLTRPSEILAILIPLLWGLDSKESLKKRAAHVLHHKQHVLFAAVALLAVVSIQVIYWMHTTGQPLEYSYRDQGFNFFKVRISDGLFDVRAGWLLFTPVLVIALLGFIPLFRKRRHLFYVSGIFFFLFTWMTLSWSEWNYGGGLGHRAMVQSYAVLAIPLAAMLQWLSQRSREVKLMAVLFVAVCIWYNGWLTHHAHRGGLLRPGVMTDAYFWSILGKNKMPISNQFLLDSDERYAGPRKNVRILATRNFDQGAQDHCNTVISGTGSGCVQPGEPEVELLRFYVQELDAQWLRASLTFKSEWKEWNTWNMPVMSMQIRSNGQLVKRKLIRPFRVLGSSDTQRLWVDLRIPGDRPYDAIMVYIDNGKSNAPLYFDDLDIESFDPG